MLAKLFATIIVILLVGMTAHQSKAVTIEGMLKGCENFKYLENQASKLTWEEIAAASGCGHYISALIELNQYQCLRLKEYNNSNPNPFLERAMGLFGSASTDDISAVTQSFINWAKANPEWWHLPPSWGSVEFFNDKWPCK